MFSRFTIAMFCGVIAVAAQAQSAVDFRDATSVAMPATISVKVDIGPQDNWNAAMRDWNRGAWRARNHVDAWVFNELSPQDYPLRSGFAVGSDLVITLNIPPDSEELEVLTGNGKKLTGKVVVRDLVTGLTAIRVEGADQLPTLKVSDADPTAGMPVAVSWMRGGEHVAVDSATVASQAKPFLPMRGFTWKLDSDVTHDALGAPVVDVDGALLGVTAFSSEGDVLCIPTIHVVRLMMAASEQDAKDIQRGRLGIVLTQSGVSSVTDVADNTPAMEAGLLPGDLIKRINDYETSTQDDVLAAVAMARGGDEVTVVVERGDESIETNLELAALTAKEDPHAYKPQSNSQEVRRAFRIEDGKLVPLDGNALPLQDLRDFERLVVPIDPIPPRPLGGFQVERSGLEEALQALEADIKTLNERVKSMQSDDEWRKRTDAELKRMSELTEKILKRLEEKDE